MMSEFQTMSYPVNGIRQDYATPEVALSGRSRLAERASMIG